MAEKFSLNGLIKTLSKIISEEKKEANKHNPRQQAHQLEIENAVLVLAAEVIRCHRNYSGESQEFIRQFISKQFGGTGIDQRVEIIYSHLETGTEPYTKIACKELVMLTTAESRHTLVQFLFGVAAADDFVTAKETRCIQRIAGYLKINETDFRELKNNFISKNNPYHVLGIENDSSLAQAKTAYRKMVLKFHPDKKEEGTSDREAELKFREIQRAFDTIKQQKEQ